MSKYKNNKTRCAKNKYLLTAREVADMVNCSESYVKQIRSGTVSLTTDKAVLVLEVDRILDEGKSLLIKEVERIVKL